MTDREKLEWAQEHHNEFMDAIHRHPEGQIEATIYVDVWHREAFIAEMFRNVRASRTRVAIETVDAAQAAESEPPDAWDARDKCAEAANEAGE